MARCGEWYAQIGAEVEQLLLQGFDDFGEVGWWAGCQCQSEAAAGFVDSTAGSDARIQFGDS